MSDEKPGGLPPIVDVDETTPETLPPVAKSHGKTNLDGNRNCPRCGEEGRPISNELGLSVFCNACKFSWPISSAPLGGVQPMTPVRGIRKKTVVEPDWDIAFDNNFGEDHGPPRRK